MKFSFGLTLLSVNGFGFRNEKWNLIFVLSFNTIFESMLITLSWYCKPNNFYVLLLKNK
ncbi:hypothetical protein SD960_06325 [Flavobacterium sp. MMLR14_040]|uniref:hypothetical protein n=1 Tax=Flavobacterium sp. MMLR14_040 TaxID=3093843 RepID=UPI00298F8EAB|nr:hypothetical protein [Flavobacterium sp. MMLR14_040]MDW8849701.1 hypothetical protein [Flavobacterium sp. MMLR14_040]